MTGFMAAKAIIAALALGEAQDWGKADLETRRLPPSAFTELPASIQKERGRWLELTGSN
jgi:hypothetical protein